MDNTLRGVNDRPVPGELEAARRILTGLHHARKTYALYPEGHSMCANALAQAHAQLMAFIARFGNLKFEIEKDYLSFKGEVMALGQTEAGTMPLFLFRDGIRWLEFMEGISPEELDDFIKIINKYSILSEEPDGDIVTAIWELQPPHIKYKVADLFWDVEQETDARPRFDPGPCEDSDAVLSGTSAHTEYPALPAIAQSEIIITPEEESMILKMVRMEERQDPTAYLDALFDSLLAYHDKENFEIILEVLQQEFKDSLARKDFDIALKILQSLEYVFDICQEEIGWAVPIIEDCYFTISSAQSLAPLQAVWPQIDAGEIVKIKQIFTYLKPEAISTLAIILLQQQSPQLRKLLMNALITLAAKDIQPLEALIKSPDEKLVQMLVQVLANLKGEQPVKVLMGLVRHKSERVRMDAIKVMLQRGPEYIQHIFTLIDDSDRHLSRLILKSMGHSRNKGAEELLLGYLKGRRFKKTEAEHVIACFTALGQCGSSDSVAFLRQTLIGSRWGLHLRQTAQMRGAAMALRLLGIPEAQQVLEEASRSYRPHVRRTVKQALA